MDKRLAVRMDCAGRLSQYNNEMKRPKDGRCIVNMRLLIIGMWNRNLEAVLDCGQVGVERLRINPD
jgi:hypothetical protein